MKVKYFEDTDTLYIELRAGDIVATKDLVDISPGGGELSATW